MNDNSIMFWVGVCAQELCQKILLRHCGWGLLSCLDCRSIGKNCVSLARRSIVPSALCDSNTPDFQIPSGFVGRTNKPTRPQKNMSRFHKTGMMRALPLGWRRLNDIVDSGRRLLRLDRGRRRGYAVDFQYLILNKRDIKKVVIRAPSD